MNDQTYVANIKNLKDCIAEPGSVKWPCLSNPEKDFTQNHKI